MHTRRRHTGHTAPAIALTQQVPAVELTVEMRADQAAARSGWINDLVRGEVEYVHPSSELVAHFYLAP